ncbi:TPM domain-containing protein [Ekhidna sp. To15]|uniref:TPM domain-containing protein n=1 Tax=Ekhidna sp. To15 TaxID=3395267 RepID=UPI003F525010
MKKYIFTDTEKKQVEEAVASLEKESCGEIVPFFAGKSDDYAEVSWYIASLLGIAGLAVIALLSYTWSLPPLSFLEAFITIIALMVIGYFLPILFPIIKRLIISDQRALEMVSLRAKEAFLNEKVYATEEHVGILIYISRLEHIVLVLGDEGINAKVQEDDWVKVVSLITDGLKRNEIGDGLVNGINHCKDLLLKNGFVRKDSDTNELSNELRIKE